MPRTIVIFTLMFVLLSSCAGEEGAQAEPVKAYLQSIVDQDVDRLSTLVCSGWADSALLELDAFMGVQAALEDVECSLIEAGSDQAAVSCSGSIVATYNNEQQQFSLEGRRYHVVKEGGEWLVCGYK